MSAGEVDDLAGLAELDEKTLLAEIEARYNLQRIYTYIGDILIAVNPYKAIPIYGPESWKQYSDVKLRQDLPPHIYAISDAAYQNLIRNEQNQCCVVSGESGAGKTESTKLMIEHIVQLCRHSSSDLDRRIVQVNPLLEAFGNAQTVINDNSSRFGKFIELSFDHGGRILGAGISEYLLEKSRVVTHGEGERSFHIFYYLFAGLDRASKEANLLDNPEDHRILKQYPAEKIFEDKSKTEFCRNKWNELLNIMKTVGFLELEIEGILAVLAAILHIADIKFTPDPDSDGVLIQNESILSLISQLLAVNTDELVKAFISNTSSIGSEKVTSLKNESQANDGRDALAKALYGRLFSWIVSKVNALLKPSVEADVSGSTIGILDIYGFENFKNNSFEQLCINVANEQLQSFFNLHIFQLELAEYKREEVAGESITFVDNRPLLDMFMDKLGLFALLDEQSRFPQATDQTLIEKLTQNLKKYPDFLPAKRQGLEFMIQHFAGTVTYSVSGFLEKNRDTLSDSIMRCLKTSNSLLVTEIFNLLQELTKNGTVSRNPLRISVLMKGPVRLSQINTAQLKQTIKPSTLVKGSSSGAESLPHITRTLASHFKNSLDGLLQKLMVAQPHFIRCIKPNALKEADNFESQLVLQQLSYTGVLETVKIRRQGYSSRLPFADFIQRYGLITLNAHQKETGDAAQQCQQLMAESGLKDWQIGKTKVFLKYWQVEKLNLMMTDVYKNIINCQKFWRAALAQLRVNELRQRARETAERLQSFCQEVTQLNETLIVSQQQQYSNDLKDLSATLVQQENKPSGETRESRVSTDSRVSWQPERPPAFVSGRPETVNLTTQLLLDETLDRLVSLSTDIWSKLYFMEKNYISGKVYIREWEVVLDDSDADYDGLVIGINSTGFDRNDSEDCREVLKLVGKGVKIQRDDDGSIFMAKLTSCDVIFKDCKNPKKNCLSTEIVALSGNLGTDLVKVFDMSIFKQRVAGLLWNPEWDPWSVARLCVLSFSFNRDTTRDIDTPCWVCILNFVALDLLGKSEVLDEFVKRGQIPPQSENLMKKWKSLDFRRMEDGYGTGSHD